MNNKTKNKIKASVIILFSLFFLFSYVAEISPQEEENVTLNCNNYLEEAKSFSDIQLEAKSAYVFDIFKNEPIFELNAHSQLPLASLTKIMTAIIAMENIPQDSFIEIKNEAVSQEGDYGLKLGEKWQVLDLIDSMLVSSSNDAAFALALGSNKQINEFVALMNNKAKELSLMQTYFFNPTGLDVYQDIAGGYGSAKDIASLLNYSLKNHPSLLRSTSLEKIDINSRFFKNTNALIEELPGVIASKTGFSHLAGGNLAMIVNIGLQRPVIIVVLGSSEKGRFEDVKKLYYESLNYLIKNG